MAAGGHDLQRLPVAVEEHDRADTGVDRAHRPLQDVGQQVLNVGDLRGHLDHLVQGAELEHEIFEALGGGAQVGQHAAERVGQLADLDHRAQPRDGPVIDGGSTPSRVHRRRDVDRARQ